MAETKIKSDQAIDRHYYVDVDGTTTLTGNIQVVSGHVAIAGAAAGSIQVTQEFGVTFDDAPVVTALMVGKNTSTSTTWPPSGGESECFVSAGVPTTTQIVMYIRRNDAGNLTNGHTYFIAWTATGVIS